MKFNRNFNLDSLKKYDKIIIITVLLLGYSIALGYKDINSVETYIDESIEDEITENKLISAVGENKIEGYVYTYDLYEMSSQPSTPDEAVEYIKEKEKNERNPFYKKSIPLYDEDGVTVVGEYRID